MLTAHLQERKPERLTRHIGGNCSGYLRQVAWLVFCLLALYLAGCSHSITPTPEATVGVQIHLTATPTVPPTPTKTATATLAPTPTTVPTAVPPTAEPLHHTVQSGEWPELIAQQYGIPVEELLAANGLNADAVLNVGQVLLIPTPPPTAIAATKTPSGEEGPASQATPVPTATSEPLYYTIVAGDYPESIAKAFGIALEDLLSANGLEKESILQVGQQLIIPTPTPEPQLPTAPPQTPTPEPTSRWVYVDITYVVTKGDTIETIADKYGVPWEDIANANGISKNSILQIGQQLTIPNVATEATSIEAGQATATAEPSSSPEASETASPEAATPTPSVLTYTVSQGDYLELIAEQFGISAEELAKANSITVDAVIHVGQELVIPIQATAIPTAALSATPTAKPLRASPTPQPTSIKPAELIFQQPALLAPANKAVFEGEEAAILLNWKSIGILAKNEWYQVRIWTNDEQQEPNLYYTKSTSWRPPVGFYKVENAPYTIRWQVQVVRIGKTRENYTVISPASTIYYLYWR